MGYYMAGDYYAAGGIFGSIGKFIGGVAKIGSKLLPGPIGGAAGIVGNVLGGGGTQPLSATGIPTIAPAPGVVAAVQRAVPGGASGFVDTTTGKPVRLKKDGTPYKKPTMNVGNARALRRSIRRQAGFVKLARRALKGTGYRIASSSSRPRRDLGAGHTHVR